MAVDGRYPADLAFGKTDQKFKEILGEPAVMRRGAPEPLETAFRQTR